MFFWIGLGVVIALVLLAGWRYDRKHANHMTHRQGHPETGGLSGAGFKTVGGGGVGGGGGGGGGGG